MIAACVSPARRNACEPFRMTSTRSRYASPEKIDRLINLGRGEALEKANLGS
jgi:hypothetical protein